MKKWAKVCVWIGIIWIILVLIGLGWVYFQTVELAKSLQNAEAFGMDTTGIFKLNNIIDLNHPFFSLLPIFLILGIPSWILFILSAIWGRKKNNLQATL